MKTYLVTGGAGFIGSNFIHYIFKKHKDDIRVINMDCLTYAGNLENLKEVESNPNYTFVKADVTDKDAVNKVFAENEVDYVVHFAAESHVDRSIRHADVFVKTNVLGTLNILEGAKRAWETESGYKEGKKMLHVSTDEVYGSLGKTGFFTETTPLDPHSPYSASKAGSDLLCKSYFDTHRFPVNITRCSNNYGPYQFPEKLIPLIINNCINKKDLPIYGDGMNIRDWLYVEDHCHAIDLVLREAEPGQIYNIGGFNERTNIFIVKEIIKVVGEKYPDVTEELIKYVADRKGHDRRYAIDSSKITKDLGWKPVTMFEDGIVLTIKWYLDNMQWMKNVINGDYIKYYQDMYK